MTDISLLKTDVQNELKNEKYYVQKELERIATSESDISHKKRVKKTLSLIKKLNTINSTMTLVDAIFAPPAPAPVPKQPVDNDGTTVPNNVVESQAVVNDQGQSHSE